MAEWVPYLLAGGTSLVQWSAANTRSVAAYYTSLPTDCRGSIIHVDSVCMGSGPLYFPTPGFAPFSLSWGWFIMGILLGAILGTLVMHAIGSKITSRNSRSPWQPLLEIALSCSTDADHKRLLRHLLHEGDNAITRAASAANLSVPEFIYRVVQQKPAGPSTHPWNR